MRARSADSTASSTSASGTQYRKVGRASPVGLAKSCGTSYVIHGAGRCPKPGGFGEELPVVVRANATMATRACRIIILMFVLHSRPVEREQEHPLITTTSDWTCGRWQGGERERRAGFSSVVISPPRRACRIILAMIHPSAAISPYPSSSSRAGEQPAVSLGVIRVISRRMASFAPALSAALASVSLSLSLSQGVQRRRDIARTWPTVLESMISISLSFRRR